MNRVIIAGSPRSNGRSAHLAEMLFEANIDECPEDEIYLVPVSELDIYPCIACGACRTEREVTFEDEDGNEKTELVHQCVIDDEMQDVYPLLDAADELVVVAPVFFSGVPASLKALLDRMQPYFWANTRKKPKRPATLHVIGEGGDPHGYAPLVSEVRSATAVAGFRLERVLDWVGKIDADGTITSEADVVEDATSDSAQNTEQQGSSRGSDRQSGQGAQAKSAAAQRPKLNLSSGGHNQGKQGDRGRAAADGDSRAASKDRRGARGQASKQQNQQNQHQKRQQKQKNNQQRNTGNKKGNHRG